MRKLKEDKRIKWREMYTERTMFLKEMYHDCLGPDSYFRFEGEQVDGPGEWYVVISPAGVKDIEQRWFAGIRKMPDKWPAGGKKFDNIVDAFNYAFDTWGVPKPRDLPHYSTRDLVGLTKECEAWKEKRKHEGEKAVEKEDKDALFDVVVLKKNAMAAGLIHKAGLVWHHDDFEPFFRGMSDEIDTEELYRRIIDAGCDAIRQSGYRIEGVPNGEGFVDSYIRAVAAGSDGHPAAPMRPTEVPVAKLGSLTEFMQVRRSSAAKPWASENIPIYGVVERFVGRQEESEEYRDLESRGFFGGRTGEGLEGAPLRLAVAAIVARVGRLKRGEVLEVLDRAGVDIPDEAAPLIRRSNFEEAVASMHLELMRSRSEYRNDHAVPGPVDDDGNENPDGVDDFDLPINLFVQYSKLDSGSRLIYCAPYKSKRDFGDEYCFDDSTLTREVFLGAAPLLADHYETLVSFFRSHPLFGQDIVTEGRTSASGRMADIIADAFAEIPSGQLNLSRPERTRTVNGLLSLFKGSMLPLAQDPETGDMISVRATPTRKAVIYQALGSWYAGTMNITDALSHNLFSVSSILGRVGDPDKLMIAASPLKGNPSTVAATMDSLFEPAVRSNAVDPLAVREMVDRIGAVNGQVTPKMLSDIAAESGVPIHVSHIFEAFRGGDAVRHALTKEDVAEAPSNLIPPAAKRTLADIPGDEVTSVEICASLVRAGWNASQVNAAMDNLLVSQSMGLSSLVEGLGAGATVEVLELGSGAKVPHVKMDSKANWRLLKALFGDIWGLRELDPDLYRNILTAWFIPNALIESNPDIMQIARSGDLDEFERVLETYVGRRETVLADVNSFVGIAPGEGQNSDDFPKNNAPGAELLFDKAAKGNSPESRMENMQKRVLFEIVKRAGTGQLFLPGLTSQQSADAATEFRDWAPLQTPATTEANIMSGVLERELDPAVAEGDVFVPGSGHRLSEYFDGDGNPVPKYVFDADQNAFYRIRPERLKVSTAVYEEVGDKRAAERMTQGMILGIYSGSERENPFKIGRFGRIKLGTQSPEAWSDGYSQMIRGDEQPPIVDEMLAGAKSYDEFMKRVALGWFPSIEGVPLRISGVGQLEYGFGISELAKDVTSIDLASSYAETNGELEEMEAPLSAVLDSIGRMDDNIASLVDLVRVRRSLWWRDESEQPMYGSPPVPLARFLDPVFVRSVHEAGPGGRAAKRAQVLLTTEMAKQMVKWEIIKDISAGRFSEIYDETVQESPEGPEIGQMPAEMGAATTGLGELATNPEMAEADAADEAIDAETEHELQEELPGNPDIDYDLGDDAELSVMDLESDLAGLLSPDDEGEDDDWLDETESEEVAAPVPQAEIDVDEGPSVTAPAASEPEELSAPPVLEEPPAGVEVPAPRSEPDADEDGDMSDEEQEALSLFGFGSLVPEESGTLMRLAVTAKLLCCRGSHEKASGINEFVKGRLAARAAVRGRRAVREALGRLSRLSLKLVKKGKTKEAREINAIIQRYIGETEESS